MFSLMTSRNIHGPWTLVHHSRIIIIIIIIITIIIIIGRDLPHLFQDEWIEFRINMNDLGFELIWLCLVFSCFVHH